MKKPSIPKIKVTAPKIDFKRLADDFKTMDWKEPGAWPFVPKLLILAAIFVGCLAAAAFLGWASQLEELSAKQKKEVELKDDWLAKKKQAVNLDEYRKQLAEIDRSFGDLLKQLPNR